MKILKIFLKLLYARNNLNMLHRHFLLCVNYIIKTTYSVACALPLFAISKYRTSVGQNLDLTANHRYHKYHKTNSIRLYRLLSYSQFYCTPLLT